MMDRQKVRAARLAGIGLALLFLGASAAKAAEPRSVRFAYLTAVDLLPYYVADKKGFFNEVGLKVEPTLVTGGAAVVGAVVGGSAEVGYSGSVPLISARIQGLPLKFFSALALDKGPSNYTLVYVAKDKSGIKTAADLKGKTIAMNARSGQCELIARLRLGDVGLSINDVKVTTLPFPQMQVALQLGNIDAACNNDPFLASMKQAGMGTRVMAGLVEKARLNSLQVHTGLFASETWLAQNRTTAEAFRSAIGKAMNYIAQHESESRQILVEYTKIDPSLAEKVELSIAQTDMPTEALQPVIDAAVQTGIIDKRIEAKEMIFGSK